MKNIFIQTPYSSGKKKPVRLSVFFFFLVIILATVAGISSYIYGKVKNNPLHILLRSYEAIQAVGSYALDISGETRTRTQNGPWNIVIQSKSQHDLRKNSPRAVLRVSSDIIGPQEQFVFKDISFHLMSPSVEKVYFNLLNVPKFFFINFEPVYNTWILAQGAPFSENTTYEKNIKDLREKIQKEFSRLSMSNTFFDFEKGKKDESVFHYRFTLNREKFKNFVKEFSNFFARQTDHTISDIIRNTEKYSSSALIAGEIIISKKDYLPQKILLFSKPLSGKQENLSAKIELVFSQYNENFILEEPKEFIKFEDAFQKVTGIAFQRFFPPSDGEPNPEKADTVEEKDSDADGLPDFLEERLGTDRMNNDTDGDTYQDGEEFHNGYNPNGPGKMVF